MLIQAIKEKRKKKIVSMLNGDLVMQDENLLNVQDSKSSINRMLPNTRCSANVSESSCIEPCSPNRGTCTALLPAFPADRSNSELPPQKNPTLSSGSAVISLGSVDVPYYSTFAQKVFDAKKRIQSIRRLLPRYDDDVFVASVVPIEVLPPDKMETNVSDSVYSSLHSSTSQDREDYFPLQSDSGVKTDTTEDPEVKKMQLNIVDIMRIQNEVAPSKTGSYYSLVTSLRLGSISVVVLFFLLSMCIVLVYYGLSENAKKKTTVLAWGIAVNVILSLALLVLVYNLFWHMDAKYYLEALQVALSAAKNFQLCQSVKEIENLEHFKVSIMLGFELRSALQNLIQSILLASHRVESLNELLEMKEAEARQQLQEPLPTFNVWQESSEVEKPMLSLLGSFRREVSRKDSFRRLDLGSASVFRRSITGDFIYSGQSSTVNQFLPDMETLENPSTARGGQSDAVAGGEIGPMVVYIICKLFLNDLHCKRAYGVDSRVFSAKLREMTNTFNDAVTQVAISTGGAVVGIELDSAIITFNAFLPIPAVSAMSTAYKAAIALDLELKKKKSHLTCNGMLNISWGMVLQQVRVIVGTGGPEYLKQPYVYSPELEFGYQVVELCRLLQCTILSLAPNAQSNRSVQIIPVDVIGVAAEHTMFLYEIKMRDSEDIRALEDKMISSLLQLHHHKFEEVLKSLLEIRENNHNVKRMCYLAAYFRKLARQKKLQIAYPYFRAGPSWEFLEILALQTAMSPNLTKSVLENNANCQEAPPMTSKVDEGVGKLVELEGDSSEKGSSLSVSSKISIEFSETPTRMDANETRGALTFSATSAVSAKNSINDIRLFSAEHKLSSSNSTGALVGTARSSHTLLENVNSCSAEISSGGRCSKLPTMSSVSPSTSLLYFASLSQDHRLVPDIVELEGSSLSGETTFSKDNLPPFPLQESFNQSSSMAFKIPSLQSSLVVGSLTRSQMVSARNAQRAVVVTGSETTSVSTETTSRVLKFSLGDLIAKGSGGTEVYRGLHPNGRIVAIKKVMINNPSVDLKAAERELETLATLKHPNILRYIASCHTGPYFYIIMEFVSGGSLTDLIRNFGPLPESAIHRYTIDSLSGLEYLHRRGIVHRDISTNNIMVTIDGECKIADFGGAFLASDNENTPALAEAPYGFQWASTFLEMPCSSMERSQSISFMGSQQIVSARPAQGNIFGTPIYMSPQAARGIVDAKNDIWSLGIAICYCATGCIPFKNEDLMVSSKVFLESLSNGSVRPIIPSKQLDEGLESFVRLCLQEELEDRPSASQLLKNPYILQGTSRQTVRTSI